MHPTLFTINSQGIHTYGVTIAVGFIVAILLGVRGCRRQGIRVDRFLDLAFWVIISSLLGSRLLFLITEWSVYYDLCRGVDLSDSRGVGQILHDCSMGLHLWEGGLVYYGGLIGAVLTAIWFTRRHHMGFLRVADLCVPLLALGHFAGRLGCFAGGCCYGKVTSASLGLPFPRQSMAFQEMLRDGLIEAGAVATPPLHPTQLYEALAELCICLVLLWINQRKRFHGQGLLTYLMLYPLVRFVVELLRADPDRHFVVALQTPTLNSALGLSSNIPVFFSTSQLISVLLVLAAGTSWIVLRKKISDKRP